MIYDFILSRGTIDIQNNLAFMRKTLESSEESPITLQAEFQLLQSCILRFINETREDIEESVLNILKKITTFTAPLDNEVTFRTISELICSLRFYQYDVFLIRRPDIIEDFPLDDGLSIVYLLDNKTSKISHIVEGKGREIDDTDERPNMSDAVMTWLISQDIGVSSEVENLCYLDNIRNDYQNMKFRNSSFMYDATNVYNFLRELDQKVLLITNIIPGEYEIDTSEASQLF